MKISILSIMSLIFFSITYAQEYNVPESAAYDPASNRYFISNYGDGNIIQIDSTGKKSFFKQGLSKSLGMIIKDDILYVVNNFKMVKGFRLSDSQEVFEVLIKEAQFLNDITCDENGFLYVTDSRVMAIYKIDISGQTYSLFVKTQQDNPNGIVYDKANKRLVLCYFHEHTQVDQVSLSDSVLSVIIKTELHNFDGIAMDKSGNFYISSWGAGSFSNGFKREGTIYRFDHQFKKDPVKVLSGLYGPADIYYSKEKQELIIPLFLDNNVTFQ